MTPNATHTQIAPRARRQTVIVDGITWEVHSRNERAATVNERHLFACRCNPSRPWALIEMDRPVQTGAREIGRHGTCATSELSARAKSLPREEFYRVVRTAHESFGRVVLHVMSPGGIIEATFYGEDYRGRANDLAVHLNNTKGARKVAPQYAAVASAQGDAQ